MRQGRPLYLLLRRSPGERLYPGLWQFVSGSIERGESADQAALRELREETGFSPEAFWVVPHVSTFYEPARDIVNLSPLFAARVPAGAEPVLSSEHDQHRWLEYEAAAERLVWPGQREGLRIVHEYIAGGRDAAKFTQLR